ncbi:sensor histidine kinase [Amycolatopsis nigrescens]|uniref:sensor histidine kinase n=1 Tax=Amycolatopsis nigrescens TaxID=381445 RepID=UPI000371E48C|nr:HAMP domain-containing sensor histidine kinase [Amycolatopsis nigrescens]
MTTAEPVRDRRDSRGSRVSARVRIMGWFMLVMTAGLAVVVLLVAEFERAAVDDRVNRALEQDVEEFRTFARAGYDQGQGRAIQDAWTLFGLHLGTQYIHEAEVLLGVVPLGNKLNSLKQIDQSVQNVPLDQPALRSMVDDPAGTGTLMTTAGEFRWLRADVLPPGGGGTPSGWFIAGYFVEPLRADVAGTVRTLIWVSLAALVLAAGVSWLAAGRILAPVRTVRLAAAELTEADLTHRIPVHGRDDIAALAEQFNAMLDRLERAFSTRRQFLDDAGHELRTPITIILGHLDLMGDDPAERAEVVRLCTDELERMARIVDELLLLAKTEQPDFLRAEWVSVPELSSDIEAKARAIAARRWTLEAIGEGEAWLDPQRVTQAVLQLAQNAVQHTADGDPIRIGSALSDGTVSFWVTDTGPGVPEEDVERIFDRFVRGSDGGGERTGAGLGLAIVRAIAEAHQGRARMVSEPGYGATFGIELPATPGPKAGREVTRWAGS